MMRKTQSGPHKFLWKRLPVTLLCMLAVVVLGVSGKTFGGSSFPGSASPVLSTALWAGRDPRSGPNPPYNWLPDGDLAYLETTVTGKLRICYQKMDSRGPIGTVRRGPELSSVSLVETCVPSPDEQWIACLQTRGNATFGTVFLSAGGKTTRTLPDIFIAWLPDSRSFLANSTRPPYGLKIDHLDSPRTETLPATTQADTLIPGLMAANSPNFLIGGRFSRVGSNGGATVASSRMTLRLFRVARPDVVQVQWQAALPSGMDLAGAGASPDNKHLLWVAGASKPSLFGQWLNRLFPMRQTSTAVELHYFLSDIHGNDMHPILEDGLGKTWNVCPTWTPDSKHLSFISKEQFYVLPLE